MKDRYKRILEDRQVEIGNKEEKTIQEYVDMYNNKAINLVKFHTTKLKQALDILFEEIDLKLSFDRTISDKVQKQIVKEVSNEIKNELDELLNYKK